jgi:HD-GYP domain-containing protein (c-di-GMP phosphodiesterase class II)
MALKKKAPKKKLGKPKAAKAAKAPKAKAAKAQAPTGEVEALRAELARKEAKVIHLENLMLMQLAKLQVMQEVQRVSSGNFSLDEMLELFMDVVLRTTNSDSGSILLCEPESTDMHFHVVRGPHSAQLKAMRVKAGEGIAGWVAKTGQSVLSEDVSKDHRFNGNIAKQIKVIPQSILAVPLKGKTRMLGVMEIINRSVKKPFSYDDLSAMESLASQIGMVMENARLFAAHNEEIRRLEALSTASGVVNSTLDLKPLLKLLTEMAAKTLRAEASSILMVDPATGDLVFDVAVGEKSDRMKEIRVPKGQGIAGAVAESGRPLLIPDASKDPRFFKKADEKSSFVTRNMIAVPLVARGVTIGVMEVLNRLGDETFTHEDTDLLQALGHQSAIALQNAQLFQNLQDSFLATVRSLAQAVDAKDSYTAGHSSRVTQYSVFIGEELKVGEDQIRHLRMAGLLHDVGKIGIKDSVLSKPGQLDDEEFAIMKSHPGVGGHIMAPVTQLKDVIPGIVSHHERFDGKGYPAGLKGEEIPLLGRIIGVADAFDAMTSDRVYRPRLSDEIAIAELKKHSGTQFDSRIVKAFLSAYEKGLIKTEPSKFQKN